jgi:hypothetical protein
MKINIIPKMIGSVGRLSPKPPSKFWRFTANGVKKTVRSINLSSEKIASNKMTIAAGNKFK